MDAEIPGTATNVTMAYRMNSGFSRADDTPGLVGEVRQFGAGDARSHCDQKAAQ